jgi:hypothetical protein
VCSVECHSNWVEFYPDAGEEIPKDLPPEEGPRVRMTVYVDADQALDIVTRRSITGILVMLNNMPIIWISECHKTVKASTYSSELVSSRVAKFGANLNGKYLTIDKSLYGLKTSAARFHDHLSESLLRLGYKKSKHDPDLWMVDKSSYHEYLATYVDDILIWIKDPMAVIKSLEKTYMLKSVGISEYYLDENV